MSSSLSPLSLKNDTNLSIPSVGSIAFGCPRSVERMFLSGLVSTTSLKIYLVLQQIFLLRDCKVSCGKLRVGNHDLVNSPLLCSLDDHNAFSHAEMARSHYHTIISNEVKYLIYLGQQFTALIHRLYRSAKHS